MLLLAAGIDTTWHALGSSLWHLATHAQDRKRLLDQPELMPSAVEELLRAYSPVTIGRLVVQETELDGCRMEEGERVLMAFGAANRDPEVFPDPQRVILDRSPNPHVAFGVGIHHCAGIHLARLEMTVALEEWMLLMPDFQLSPSATVVWSSGLSRGPVALPLIIRR